MAEAKKILHEELNSVLEALGWQKAGDTPAQVADALVNALQEGGADVPVLNKVLQRTLSRCFDRVGHPEEYRMTQNDHEVVLAQIKRILGYLVLSLVDERDARDLSSWLHDDITDFYFELRTETQGSVELFLSYKQQRRPRLAIKGRHVVGKHVIYVDSSPLSWDREERVNELLLTIWQAVFQEDRQDVLHDVDLEELQEELRNLREIDEEPNYCLAVQFDDNGNDFYQDLCQQFLDRLEIPLIRFGLGKSQSFHGREIRFMSALRLLLQKIDEIDT